MKITAVQPHPISVPLTAPMPMANQELSVSSNVLVEVKTDEGLTGWGEGVAAPAVTGETQARILAGIEFLAPHLLGADPLRIGALWRDLRSRLPGNDTALGAIDIALHDVAGKALGIPVYQLWGGAIRTRIPALTLLGSGDPDRDAASAAKRLEQGYRWFKLKLALAEPDVEAETMHRLSELVGTEGVLAGDANEGWDETAALRFVGLVAELPIRFLEQPVARSAGSSLARLARRSPIPICADESVHDPEDLERMAEAGLAGVSLKLIKLGGITGVMRAAHLCEHLGLAVNLAGKVAETSVAAAANLHCAAAIPAIDFGCSPGHQTIAADVTRRPPRFVDGCFHVPSGPGLGIEVDEDLVQRLVSTSP